MFKMLAAVAAAFGLSSTAASAAIPLKFDVWQGDAFAQAQYTAPSEGAYQYVHLYWNEAKPLLNSFVFQTGYEYRFLYWDDAMEMVWGNEADYYDDCTAATGCIVQVGAGHAIARLELPRGQGSFDACVPGHKRTNCYEWYVPHASLFYGDFTTGGAPTGYLEFGKSGAIPEPATWAMMIGGFGLAGAALRRRRAGLAV